MDQNAAPEPEEAIVAVFSVRVTIRANAAAAIEAPTATSIKAVVTEAVGELVAPTDATDVPLDGIVQINVDASRADT